MRITKWLSTDDIVHSEYGGPGPMMALDWLTAVKARQCPDGNIVTHPTTGCIALVRTARRHNSTCTPPSASDRTA